MRSKTIYSIGLRSLVFCAALLLSTACAKNAGERSAEESAALNSSSFNPEEAAPGVEMDPQTSNQTQMHQNSSLAGLVSLSAFTTGGDGGSIPQPGTTGGNDGGSIPLPGTGGTGTAGTSGVLGASGIAGSAGTAGSAGGTTTGTQGSEGSAGSAGTPTTGSAGVAGSSGSAGTGGQAGGNDGGFIGSSGTAGGNDGGQVGATGIAGTTGGSVGSGGVAGIVGSAGSSGTAGGISGNAGETGTQGSLGAAGTTGGETGTLGNSGNAGQTGGNDGGSLGQTGTAGGNDGGQTGTTGTAGVSGQAGNTGGNSGEAGSAGVSGNGGAAGTAGTSGIAGSTGNAGQTGGNDGGSLGQSGTAGGSDGGQTGTAGTAGVSGQAGNTGGNSGTVGSSGNTGSGGAAGSAAQTGTAGSGGANGAQGSVGSNGSAGNGGSNGYTGSAGNSGSTGYTGSTGSTGTTGNSGCGSCTCKKPQSQNSHSQNSGGKCKKKNTQSFDVTLGRVCSVRRSNTQNLFFEDAKYPIVSVEAMIPETMESTCQSRNHRHRKNRYTPAKTTVPKYGAYSSAGTKSQRMLIQSVDLMQVDLFDGRYSDAIKFDYAELKAEFGDKWKKATLLVSVCDDTNGDGYCSDEDASHTLSVQSSSFTAGRVPSNVVLDVWNGRGYTYAADPEVCDKQYSPILLDLTGQGMKLSGPETGTRFDINDDGRPVSTGWTVGDTTAFLVRDLNNNGNIDSGAELFGSATRLMNGKRAPNGFEALKELDSNRDGKISKTDQDWDSLQVWIDANSNGMVERGELRSLGYHKITSMNLNYVELMETDLNGNQTRERSTFTKVVNGTAKTLLMVDIWFRTLVGH